MQHIGSSKWQEVQIVRVSGLGDGALIGWVDGACHRYNPLTNWSLPIHGPHRRHSHHEQSTTISGNGGGDNRFILMMIVAPDQ